MSDGNAKPPINVDYFEDLTGKIEPGRGDTAGAAAVSLLYSWWRRIFPHLATPAFDP